MIKKYKDFEDFLQDKHADQYIGLDDDMPDDYDNWLQELSSEEWIEYGNKFAILTGEMLCSNIVKKLSDKA